MKKFTLIMSLLLTLFATTTSAQILDRSGWKVTTSSECDDDGIMDGYYENNGHANAIIDGDANTFWHSDFGNGNASGDATRTLPQFFQIDLGTVQEFNKIGYLPRRSLFNGTVTSYKVYVSNSPFENVSSSRSAAEIVNSLGTADIESTFSYEDETTATLKTYTSNKILKGRYVLFVVMDALNYRPGYYASCAEFYLSKDTEITTPTTPTSKPLTNILDRSKWKVTVSGEQTDDGGGKDAIIDGDNSTYWHSRYWTNLPQFFQIDLGSEQEFNALGYMPRPNIGNGTVYDYKLYVSDTPFENVSSDKSAADIVNALGTADIESSFDYSNDGNESTLKTYRFPKMLRGRYVLFVATRGKKVETSGSYASCAEFYLAKETVNTTPTLEPLADILDRSEWKVTVSGECDHSGSNGNGHANALIDGDNNTFWHSNFGSTNASGDASRTLPQFFQIDLGREQEFNQLGYMPRPDLLDGTVLGYKVYVSNTPFENVSSNKSAADVVNALGTADIESSFDYGNETQAILKTYTHNKMLKGRYVLFVVTKARVFNIPYYVYATCAEFYLAKKAENTSPTSKPLTNILNRSNWVITTSGECDDVQYNTGHADAIIDGNSETFWHSNFGGSNGSGDETCKLPQFFQVDLGSVQEFNALGYLPRSNFYNGVITSYKVYVSNSPFERVTNNRSAADVVNNLGTADYEGSFSYEGETVATLKTCRFPKMFKGRYVLFVAMESENHDYGVAYACCAEFYLAKEAETTTPSSYILNRSGWTVTVSGEQSSDGGGKDAIIDGDNSTYWHSRWMSSGEGDDSRSLPQFFQIDLGSEQEFNALGYMPRPRNHNGTILDYKLYVSNTPFENVSSEKSAADIVNALGTADIESSFDYSNDGRVATLKTYTFPKMLKGRYVLFVATRTTDENRYASCAEFYLAKDLGVTYHFNVNGVEYGKKTVVGSILGNPIPTMPFLTNGEITPTSDGYDIACTENTPFVAQSTFDANTAQWYALNINGESGNYLLSNKGGSIVSTTTVSLDNHPDVLEDAYLWTFVGNLKDGYRIYSKVDQKSLALYNQLILKKGDGSLFKLYEKSDNSNFGLYVDEEKLLTRESENKIIASTEDNNNDRSTFRVQDSKLYVTNYAKPFISALTEAPENAIWDNSYMSNPTNQANYRALFLAVSANDATNEQVAALGAENAKIANAEIVNPIEEGKYYRLYNAGNSNRWLNVTLDAENTSTMRCNLNAEKSVASVVNFVRLSNVYYDMKVKGLSMADVEISVVGNRFMFDNGGYLGCEEETASFNYSEDNTTSQWYIVPATEAEIAMREVNGKSYASAYLPFPVNGVSGAEAYVGKLNDAKDVLNMTQVQGVAENTGFVLVGNANKATLSIGETTESATSDLKGSNTNIVISSPTVDLHDQYLVFGVSDGSVGFYAPSYYLETIPANKAYLETAQLASKAIAMNFGGNVTGVSQATVVANENAPIYNLSGRRVAKTVKGGVYIQNGKKFVK